MSDGWAAATVRSFDKLRMRDPLTCPVEALHEDGW
jgi:hypothetical protein